MAFKVSLPTQTILWELPDTEYRGPEAPLISWQGLRHLRHRATQNNQLQRGPQKAHGAVASQLCRLLSRRERKEEVSHLLQSPQEHPGCPCTPHQAVLLPPAPYCLFLPLA